MQGLGGIKIIKILKKKIILSMYLINIILKVISISFWQVLLLIYQDLF